MTYPMVRPKSYTPTGVPVFSWEELMRVHKKSSKCGCQVIYTENGARPCHPEEFAIKWYAERWDAVCAYERQKAAWKGDCAPPVGRLVQARNKDNKVVCWGYETGVAILLDEDMPIYARIFPDEESSFKGPPALRRALRRISLAGLPMNDLNSKTVKCPTPVRGRKAYCLGGDLHDENVAMWSDERGERPVCIDFGYHSVLSSGRGPINPVYFWQKHERGADLA